jgi:hypothetical protein
VFHFALILQFILFFCILKEYIEELSQKESLLDAIKLQRAACDEEKTKLAEQKDKEAVSRLFTLEGFVT